MYKSVFNTNLRLAHRWCILIVLPLILLCGIAAPGYAKNPPSKAKWVGTWATAPQLVEPNNMPPAPGLSNNTLRQVVCISAGGKNLRLKFSNEFGKSALVLKSVQIAVSTGGNTINEATSKQLKFNGLTELTLEAGNTGVSDAIAFDLKPRAAIAITISFGETAAAVTGHPGSRTTSYLLSGNQTAANTNFTDAVKTDHWYIITGIEEEASKAATATIGVIGDSITDGRGSGTNQQNRWPDILAVNLQKNRKTQSIGVLNLGIGGNCVLKGGLGPTALTRYDRDILKQQGLRWVIIFEGVNDLGSTRDSAAAFTVAQGLITAYQKMITEAHAQGLKVYGVTITPFKKATYYTTYRDAARNQINEWIRADKHFDAVIDFDKAIRNPTDTATILAENQSDYLHPNELGYQVMGNFVDLSLFK